MHLQGKCCGWYGKEDWGSGVVPCSCSYIISDVNSTYESHAQEICPRCYSNVSISNSTCGIYEQVFLHAATATYFNSWMFLITLFIFLFCCTGMQWEHKEMAGRKYSLHLVGYFGHCCCGGRKFKSSTQFWSFFTLSMQKLDSWWGWLWNVHSKVASVVFKSLLVFAYSNSGQFDVVCPIVCSMDLPHVPLLP